MTDDKTMRRIRLLIAKAEGTDNEAEAETFMAAAMRLMAKYGIDRAMVENKTGTGEISSIVIECPAPYAKEKATLLRAIVLPCNGHMYRDLSMKHGKNSTSEFCVVTGFPADLERIQMLYSSLLMQSIRAMNRAALGLPWTMTGPRKGAWKRTFLLGYAGGVYEKLVAAQKQAVSETSDSSSTELVLVDRKTQVEKWVEARTNLRKSPQRKLSGTGYGAGVRAGREADIDGTRIGQRDRAGIGGRR